MLISILRFGSRGIFAGRKLYAKLGSVYLGKTIRNAAATSLRKNTILPAYYEKKRADRKKCMAATETVIHKLCDAVYAVRGTRSLMSRLYDILIKVSFVPLTFNSCLRRRGIVWSNGRSRWFPDGAAASLKETASRLPLLLTVGFCADLPACRARHLHF